MSKAVLGRHTERPDPPHSPVVARVITRLNVGGPARQALLLTRRLSSEFPTILASGVVGPHEAELVDPSVTVHQVPLGRPIRPLRDVRALVAVRQLLAHSRVRILHTHMAKAGTIGRLAAFTLPTRPLLVHTYHGHVLAGYFPRALQRGFVEIERALAKHTSILLAVSPEIRDELLDLGIGRPAQFCVVPVGLELEPFLQIAKPAGRLRQEFDIASDAPLVGTIGRLVPIKDHGTLLEAIARLPDVQLVIVGDGEERHNIEHHLKQLGLERRVHLTGWRTDIADIMSDLDVLALTSRNEGTPVALIEGLAAGCPVVATDVGGVRQVVQDGISGHLVAARDSGGVAVAIGHLIAHPRLRTQMAAAGRRHVRGRFGSEQLIHTVSELYRELLTAPATST